MKMAPPEGFEPSASTFVASCSSAELRGHGLAGRIRTCGLVVPNDARRPLRYGECEMVETMGLKPISFDCKANALSVELHPRGVPGRN